MGNQKKRNLRRIATRGQEFPRARTHRWAGGLRQARQEAESAIECAMMDSPSAQNLFHACQRNYLDNVTDGTLTPVSSITATFAALLIFCMNAIGNDIRTDQLLSALDRVSAKGNLTLLPEFPATHTEVDTWKSTHTAKEFAEQEFPLHFARLQELGYFSGESKFHV